jgi:hypothetical protein
VTPAEIKRAIADVRVQFSYAQDYVAASSRLLNRATGELAAVSARLTALECHLIPGVDVEPTASPEVRS